ncbi:KpsF/GutQ family sugar-phosphate isomerase [Helicobacter pametensis]|uniref:KpsF/GutQ family sugar-phosphate isomerase n=1 Tax=Helicobacter pametensis TaxID=95149 RepID=UPI000484F308|nr:KpsF/GutQ family sugar-phosphate isomerase [Helicobacter pametensis]
MLTTAKEVLHQEAQALLNASLEEKELEQIIQCILDTQGKLIVMGVGKSGLIGAKIAATLASTGTPSFFVHPTEALHGDLGMIESKDSILAISYSGESDELKVVLPHIKAKGCKIITMTKDPQSSISKLGDHFLSLHIAHEACPLNTAPTTSTTLTLALGDALAVCLMKKRNFTHSDFASFHPGGSLGKRLFLKVGDLMQTQNLPLISTQTPLKEAIITMSKARLGSAFILQDGALVAILSDGDLRRAMMSECFDLGALAIDFASKSPKACQDPNLLAYDALRLMEEHKIQVLAITDAQGQILGALHLHMLIEAGIKS